MNASLPALGWDERRGTWGMWLFILTEAMLFVSLFFGYFFLSRDPAHWPLDTPPKLTYVMPMLAILLASSGVAEWAKHRALAGAEGAARLGILLAVAMGLTFLALQSFEYRERLRTVTPTTDAYGSMFYAITSIHGAHVTLGLCMLAYVALLPRMAGRESSPYRPLHNATLYWHFVDAAWVVIVALLYVMPNLQVRV